LKSRSLAALAAVVLLILVAGVAVLYAARPQVLDAVVYTPPSPTPTVATATAAATASVAPSPVFAASECTSATATTRQVIERYLALSTSNNVQAVTDCFAKVWLDKAGTPLPGNSFADFAASWSKAGPVTNVTITFGDTVNGCDRFGVGAQLANPSAFVYQVPPFFTVGPEAGRPRIFETGSALLNQSLATTRCQ
jgi:hypothetical protein